MSVNLKKRSEKLFKLGNFVAKACHKREICVALYSMTTREINICSQNSLNLIVLRIESDKGE